jgi:hypothetical protein
VSGIRSAQTSVIVLIKIASRFSVSSVSYYSEIQPKEIRIGIFFYNMISSFPEQ